MSVETAAAVREITDAEVDSFRRDGWVFLPGLIDRDAALAMKEKAAELMGETGVEGTLRPGLDVDFNRWHDRHFLARDGIDPFRTVTYSNQFGHAAQRFMDRDVAVRHWADMIAIKPPAGTTDRSGSTPFHQDYPCGQFDRVGNTTFWIALDEMPAERGTCRFRSGSHREGPLGRDFTPSTGVDIHDTYTWLADRYPLSEPLDMQPGDATCHSQLVLHMAPENTTDVPRWTYISIFFPADTLWTGRRFHGSDSVTLEIDKPFDHPNFPIVYP